MNTLTNLKARRRWRAIFLLSALIVFVNTFLPFTTQRLAAANGANRLAEYFVVQRSAFAVAMVIHGTVSVDAEVARSFHRIDIGPQEQELPAILALLSLDHLLDAIATIATTFLSQRKTANSRRKKSSNT